MPATDTALAHIRRESLRRAIRPLWRARWGFWIFVLATCAISAARSPSPARGAAALCALALTLNAALRSPAHHESAVPRNLLTTLALNLVAAASTGGIHSPLLFGAPMLTVVVFIVVPRRAAWTSLGAEIAAVWAMAVLLPPGLAASPPSSVLEIDRAGGSPITSAALMTAFLGAAARVGAVMDSTLNAVLRDLVRAREAALASHREQLEDLTALSGEIAHELKNPLSSVKGLAALVARDLTGKAEERMGVLRREVDRVLVKLDELLGLTKPLLPLSVETVRLAALCDEVSRLHEGIAALRGVTLDCRGDAELPCDPRKVKQLLTNLLQNALDVAPSGSSVSVHIDVSGQTACLRVEDRGPGVAREVADHLFERGVTSKPRGSGTGLTIARTIARQHGGDLTLSNRSGGGAVALCTLPVFGLPASPPRSADA